jgi:hypothetical protein
MEARPSGPFPTPGLEQFPIIFRMTVGKLLFFSLTAILSLSIVGSQIYAARARRQPRSGSAKAGKPGLA